jgi:Iap family predicted aminopeptidase
MDLRFIERNLEYLTCPDLEGRLAGSPGAYSAGEHLAAELETLGIEPAGDRGFFQAVEVPARRLAGMPFLSIGERRLEYRVDFAEAGFVSGGGKASGRLLVARDGEARDGHEFEGAVALIPERPRDFDLARTAAAAEELGVAALLVEGGEPRWFHKTVYGRGGVIPVLRVRKSIATELVSAENTLVELSLPLRKETLECRNVLGRFKGSSPDFTLALTAHYDHVGDDPDGKRFPGAFDNASGVAAVLEVSRRLARDGARFPFSVLVAFLTGEESGLWGAKRLAKTRAPDISAVVNVDGIGRGGGLRALSLGHRERGDPLAEIAEAVLRERSIESLWIEGNDDSRVFTAKGIPTVGLSEQRSDSSFPALHTPSDDLGSLDAGSVGQGAEIIIAIMESLARGLEAGSFRPARVQEIAD